MSEHARKSNDEYVIGAPVEFTNDAVRNKVEIGNQNFNANWLPVKPCHVLVRRRSGHREVWTLIGASPKEQEVLVWSEGGNSPDRDKIKAVPVTEFTSMNPGIVPEYLAETKPANTPEAGRTGARRSLIRRLLGW